MRDLYPTLLQEHVVARVEEYFVPFHGYLDRNFFKGVVEVEMLICNHDFNESANPVCFKF